MATEDANKNGRDVSIVLCGQAGQGIQTVEKLLTGILKSNGYHIFSTKEVMSRVRGGMNSTQIRVSDNQVDSPVNRIDILVPLDKGSITHVSCRITPDTVILGEKDVCAAELKEGHRLYDIPFTKLATELGNKIYANAVAVGSVLSLLGLELEPNLDFIKKIFAGKDESIISKNLLAVRKGYEGVGSSAPGKLLAGFKRDVQIKNHVLLSGSEAIGLGALAGGCNFIASYPMSPGTGVLSFLAQKGSRFGMVVEQSEDEIAAINMAIGAWYAGARAMVTTSGGGFALMTEGLSLAGMIESPLVIHLAQRPGPATGLPTRTEQGDLEFALYSGHGEFLRVIFAPGTLEEAFLLTQKAFNIADKYQIPVFVLSDEYLLDSYYNTPEFNLDGLKIDKHFIRTSKDYRRYDFSDSGISPRGIPGFGGGLVCVDSDEHDQEGRITEDCEIRTRMVDKRLGKMAGYKTDAVAPKLYGPECYKKLILCWGSTLCAVRSALKSLGTDDVAILHFSQVYPLDKDTIAEYMRKAEISVLVEGNATGQFARILKNYAGVEPTARILRYNGLSFASDELAVEMNLLLKGAT